LNKHEKLVLLDAVLSETSFYPVGILLAQRKRAKGHQVEAAAVELGNTFWLHQSLTGSQQEVEMGLADTQDAKEILLTIIRVGKGPHSENQQDNAKVLGEMLKILAKAVSESINQR
jgi:hypothetical protein